MGSGLPGVGMCCWCSEWVWPRQEVKLRASVCAGHTQTGARKPSALSDREQHRTAWASLGSTARWRGRARSGRRIQRAGQGEGGQGAPGCGRREPPPSCQPEAGLGPRGHGGRSATPRAALVCRPYPRPTEGVAVPGPPAGGVEGCWEGGPGMVPPHAPPPRLGEAVLREQPQAAGLGMAGYFKLLGGNSALPWRQGGCRLGLRSTSVLSEGPVSGGREVGWATGTPPAWGSVCEDRSSHGCPGGRGQLHQPLPASGRASTDPGDPGALAPVSHQT